jgi:hypothetical protein
MVENVSRWRFPMKSLRIKILALVGSGMVTLAVAGCTPTELITGLLGTLGGLIPTA